jgi:hypothetical protein
MNLETGWVEPASRGQGMDHLAVQAPCITLYGELLPGITNVTDRARYYSFYPWLLKSYERVGPKIPLQVALRRAECLFALVAERHATKTGEAQELHGARMVGRNRLVPALAELSDSGAVDLALYASHREETPHAYFKNRMGGLGQYYLGPLRDLGILNGDARKGPKYTIERGGALADAMGAGVDAAAVFSVLDRGRVRLKELDSLHPFCPCGLRGNALEREALIDVLFDRSNEHGAQGVFRRRSLALLLDFFSRKGRPEDVYDLDAFRAALYARSVDGLTPWNVPGKLRDALAGWNVYATNDLLSAAVQGVFWAALRQTEANGIASSSEEIGRWVGEAAARALGKRATETFGSAVAAASGRLPALHAWLNEAHEVEQGWRLLRNASEDEEGAVDRVAGDAMDVFVALAARLGDGTDPYLLFEISSEYTREYPLNLRTFLRFAKGEWRAKTLADLAAWIATRWGVETHLRVALRKLHEENLDTFRIRPGDHGLAVFGDIPIPTLTSPRIRPATQMLLDVGLLELKGETLAISPDGKKVLGASLA